MKDYRTMNDPLGMIARRNVELTRIERGGSMGGTARLFEDAKEKLATGLGNVLGEMEALTRDADKYPTEYIQKKRAELVAEARVADREAIAAVTEYQNAAMAEARKLRSAAEAEVNPQQRVAEEMERRRLAESGDAADLLAQAQQMIEDGQPSRAALLIGAIRDKGGRMPYDFHQIATDAEAALDTTNPQRKSAREIEQGVVQNLAKFRTARFEALRDTGVGINAGGLVGTGQVSDTASASIASKMSAYFDAQERGEQYSAPVGDSSDGHR